MNRIADYDVVRQLGEGSHGTFWLARTPERLGVDDEHVTVKTFVHQASDADYERVVEELRYYNGIATEQLVPIHEVGLQTGTLYYSCPYHADGSLAQPARPFTRAAVLSALRDAALGAHALHEAGTAHRSIKPGNIMITGHGAQLGDLGLAYVLNPGQTVTGLDHIDSIEFLAPELIQGQPASRASDIWALAATLHRVLTGRPIHPNVPTGSLLQALRHLLNERPTLNASLKRDERLIISQCLALDPIDRPVTALELAEIIGDLADRAEEVEPG